MTVTIKQKIEDFHNARVLMDAGPGHQLCLRNGRLELGAATKSQSEKDRKEIKAFMSSFLARVDVGIGPLTAANLKRFVFEKVMPLHHSFCAPGAMMKNPALRPVIEKRIHELGTVVEKDLNMVRCDQEIQKTKDKIRRIGWEIFNPLRKLSHAWVWATGGAVDRTLEKDLAYFNWRLGKDVEYKEALKDALIGLKLRLSHQTGAEKNGWSGSFFWKELESNARIGVYKPSDQDSISPGSPHGFARFRLHFIPENSGVVLSQSGKAHIAEAGARIAAESFHRAFMDMKADGIQPPFDEEDAIVPDTRIVEVNFTSGPTSHGIGSFQIFLKRCLPMSDAFGIDKRTFQKVDPSMPDLTRARLPEFQWLKLFHYLIFAQDDHGENTMVTYDRSHQIQGLKAIDNGQSFPARPLGQDFRNRFLEKKILSMKPMHGLRHPLAKEKIHPFFRDFLKRYASGGYLEKLSEDLYAFYQNQANYLEGQVEAPEISRERVRLMKERFAVLERLFAEQGRPLVALTPYLKGGGLDDASR